MMDSTTRISQYKNNQKSITSSRWERHQCSVNLRKSHRQKALLQRRRIEQFSIDLLLVSAVELCHAMRSSKELAAVTECRRRLCTAETRQEMLEVGAVQSLVEIMAAGVGLDENVVNEAAWAVAKEVEIGGKALRSVVECGGVDAMFSVLDVGEDCAAVGLWSLANVADESGVYRSQLLERDELVLRLEGTVQMFWDRQDGGDVLRQAAFFLVTLCKGRSKFSRKLLYQNRRIRLLLPLLSRLLEVEDEDDDCLYTDLFEALSFVAESASCRVIMEMLQFGVADKAVSRLQQQNPSKDIMCLRFLGNLVSKPSEVCDVALAAGTLDVVSNILQADASVDAEWLRECCWMLANIAAGSTANQDLLMASGSVQKAFPLLNKVGSENQNLSQARDEVVYLVHNLATISPTEDHSDGTARLFLLNHNMISALPSLLAQHHIDQTVKEAVVDILMNLFAEADRYEQLEHCIEQFCVADGVEILDTLLSEGHISDTLFEKASKFMSSYIEQDTDEDELEIKCSVFEEYRF